MMYSAYKLNKQGDNIQQGDTIVIVLNNEEQMLSRHIWKEYWMILGVSEGLK